MNFMLVSLRDAFLNVEYQKRAAHFPLFAFVLATTADKNIFPEIMTYYPELNTLTADYILVIAPQVNMLDKSGRTITNPTQIADALSTGRYLNPHSYRVEDYSKEIESFKKEQTQESIKFARFCGVELNKLPCIVFFDTLDRPKEYVIWELQDQDASSVVRDFRLIISDIEEVQNPFISLKRRRRSLLRQQQNLKLRISEINSKDIRKIASQIDELEQAIERRNKRINRLGNRGASITYNQDGTEQTLHVPTEIARLQDNIEHLHSQIETLQTSISSKHKQITDLEGQIQDTTIQVEKIDKAAEDATKPDLLRVISGLKRGKFIRRVVKDAGGVVPLLGLGLSVVGIFDN